MKILMCAMALDIGGAETHVLELSRALCNMGHDVTVASNGGVYVRELEACNIRHVKIPLHTKGPGQVIKSYFTLKKLIKKEKFDVVHAHARIPAFVCGLLCPVLNFRFVTTAHWVFDVNALWRKIAFWGEKTVAVSEDIKQYLVDSYGVYSDNISVTINGVDMEKFSPETPSDSVARELGLPEKRKTIVYVSRMDTDRSLVARQLCEIAPALKKKHPDLQVVVVGGGNTAAADALLLSRIAEKVVVVHRRDTLRATNIYHEPLEKAENVEFKWNSVVSELLSDGKLTGIKIKDVVTGEESVVECDGLFVSVGRQPATEVFKGQVELDPAGYVVAGESTVTSVPGVFAVGDVRTKEVRQVVTAVADGAVAVHHAEEFLAQKT